MDYPKPHFVGTPKWGKWVIAAGIEHAGVEAEKWTVPLEAIARYESGWNPVVVSKVCENCRGLMQQGVGQYSAAKDAGFILTPVYGDPAQAILVAIKYIQSKLPGYGGYGGIGRLLRRTDRGPGDVLRAWIEHPDWSYGKLRSHYHGY